MSDFNGPVTDADRELSPYDEPSEAAPSLLEREPSEGVVDERSEDHDEDADDEAPAEDLNREEEQAAELREDGERPVLDESLEAAYSLEEPSDDVG